MEKLKELLKKPVYKSIKVWHITLVIFALAAGTGDSSSESNLNTQTNQPTLKETTSYMKKHAEGSGFELMDSKEISFDNVNLYVFLTKKLHSSGMMYCVTTVAKTKVNSQEEFKNAIINADCGRSEKVAQWQDLVGI